MIFKSASAVRCALAALALASTMWGSGQSISSATIQGTVTDPENALVPNATVEIVNPVSGYKQSTKTDPTGTFKFNNVPFNPYTVTVNSSGFAAATQQIELRTTIPVQLKVQLQVAGTVQETTVEASASLVENDPSAHVDADASTFMKLPEMDPASGLSSAITLSTGGVAADANGFFHPEGDHAQVSFNIDGETISDQQSKVFSTQLPPDAIQSMEIVTGSPTAEYGDKSSLVVNATTKSGLGARQPFGSLEANWGSFASYGENATFGIGNEKFGNFIAVNGIRTGRFLDTPEFLPIHDIGDNENVFDRVDYQPTSVDSIHLDLFVARNWFQVPNSYDQLAQDQKQRVLTWNVAPGYQHTFSSKMLLTLNAWGRRDQVNYYGSRDPFDDTPATASQNRFLTSIGAKADLSIVQGINNLKIGVEFQQTRLLENFAFGITDPLYNAVCLAGDGSPLALPAITNPSACAGVNPGYTPNPGLLPGLVAFDLTRGGSPFNFHSQGNINQGDFYIQDQITLGHLTISAGFRDDQYDGLVSANGPQPRLGLSYLVKKTGTVIRAAYSRTFETPFNENLLLSSSTGSGGLAEAGLGANGSAPLQPGFRNQFNAGLQQKFGKYVLVDADYFWKYTHNAYDFDVLFNTPISFPIAWHNSKLDGLTGRISTVNIHGIQAYTTFGHTRARFFPPEDGGLVLQSTSTQSGVFRIDHDQELEETTNFRYQYNGNGPWVDFIWRFDSGMVVSGVPDVAAAAMLTAAEQVDIGFSCNGVYATIGNPITACNGVGKSTQLTLPQTGTENDDHNPDRVKPRNLFDISLGSDNLLHSETKQKVILRFTITNLTNKVALYNFLSTFSGTHFVEPRAYQVILGFAF